MLRASPHYMWYSHVCHKLKHAHTLTKAITRTALVKQIQEDFPKLCTNGINDIWIKWFNIVFTETQCCCFHRNMKHMYRNWVDKASCPLLKESNLRLMFRMLHHSKLQLLKTYRINQQSLSSFKYTICIVLVTYNHVQSSMHVLFTLLKRVYSKYLFLLFNQCLFFLLQLFL